MSSFSPLKRRMRTTSSISKLVSAKDQQSLSPGCTSPLTKSRADLTSRKAPVLPFASKMRRRLSAPEFDSRPRPEEIGLSRAQATCERLERYLRDLNVLRDDQSGGIMQRFRLACCLTRFVCYIS